MKKKSIVLSFIKGIGIAAGITAAALALCALLMKNVETGSKLLCGIMIAVKVLSIAAGSFVFCKAAKKKGARCGAATGAVYSCLCIGVSLLTKTAGLSFAALADVAFAVVFGAVFGIIWVNIFS